MRKDEHKSNVDTIISFIVIKKLVTPITKTSAYKLGLVNGAGKTIKEPTSDKEHEAFTILDRIVFKIKRLLNIKLLNLNNFLQLTTMNNDFYNKLVVRGTVSQKAEIKRICNDVKNIKEKFDINTDDIIYSLINEELENEF